MKAGAEGGPFEISGTAEAGDGSRQFRFEVARLFPLLYSASFCLLQLHSCLVLGSWVMHFRALCVLSKNVLGTG